MNNISIVNNEDSVYCGDALEKLKELPDSCIQSCITSPPYYGLRDYGTASWEGGNADCDHIQSENKHGGERSDRNQEGYKKFYKDICKKCGAKRIDDQIGLEETPEEYVNKLVEVFRGVRRVLRKDGTLWLNLASSYASNGCYIKSWKERHPEKKHLHTKNSGRYGDDKKGFRGGKYNIKAKDLIPIPWIVAMALQADGWYLRQDIIWHKPNPMPESVKDRCTKSHEYLFLLSKNQKYYFDNEAIKEIATGYDGRKDILMKGSDKYKTSVVPGKKEHSMAARGQQRWKFKNGLPLRNKRSVWTVPTKPFKEAHFATFPPKLIEPCILAGCPEDNIVLDPFAGAGTTGVVCRQNNRKFIGIELNPKYCDLANKRIKDIVTLMM